MPLTTGDIEPFGSGLLATGSEKYNHASPICFWDIRQPSAPVTTWFDQHHEDITQVRFHPRRTGCLVSASIDGLLCQSHFNAILTPVEEEDSLQSVIQTACSIEAFSFTPTQSVEELMAIWSPMQTALLALLDTGDICASLGDIRAHSNAQDGTQLVSIDANPDTDCPVMFLSDARGNISVHLIRSATEIQRVASFGGGHCEPVRSLLYLPEHNVVFTGGEDAKVIGWSIH